MLNTLANHGFLPHNGKDLSADVATKGLSDALNLEPDLGLLLFQTGLNTNPVPGAQTFSLEDLRTHNIIEHDGSLR